MESATETVLRDPTDPKCIAQAKDVVFDLLLYKTKNVQLTPCGGQMIAFDKGNTAKARKFERYWRTLTIVVYALEVALTAIDLIFSAPSQDVDAPVKSEFEYWYMDAAQIILAIITIYMLAVY